MPGGGTLLVSLAAWLFPEDWAGEFDAIGQFGEAEWRNARSLIAPYVLRNYSGIAHNDIIACLAYARDTLSSEKVYPSAA